MSKETIDVACLLLLCAFSLYLPFQPLDTRQGVGEGKRSLSKVMGQKGDNIIVRQLLAD